MRSPLPTILSLIIASSASAQFCTVIQTQKINAPDASPNDQFGAGVTLRDKWLLVGAPLDEQAGGDEGSVYFFVLDDGGTPLQFSDDRWIFNQKLLNWAAVGYAQRFGSSVALGTDMAFVGAPNEYENGSIHGALYTFFIRTRNTPEDPTDDDCTPLQRITAHPAVYESFGDSIAVSGNQLAVGASYGYGANGNSTGGQVYVFHRDDSGTPDRPTDDQWVQQFKIPNPEPASVSGFGCSLWMNDIWLIIGAAGTNGQGSGTGAVYVYRLDDNGTPNLPGDDQWLFHSKRVPSDPADEQDFGSSVDVSGTTMVVGAPYSTASLCGDSRSICEGDQDCAVGACDPRGNPCHANVGCAPLDDACVQPPDVGPCDSFCPRYFFNPCSGGCEPLQYGCCGGNQNNFLTVAQCEQACLGSQHVCLLPVDAGTGDEHLQRYHYDACARQCQPFIFGGSGGNANNFAILADCQNACPPPDPPPASCIGGITCGVITGAAYVFEFSDDTWQQCAKLFPPFGREYGGFGAVVAIQGQQVFVGAASGDQSTLDPSLVPNSGLVYMFERSDQDQWVPRRLLIPTDSAQYQSFGGSIAVDESRVVIGARQDGQLSSLSGAVYDFAINGECEAATIPTISAWGFGVFSCLVLVAGAIVLHRRQLTSAPPSE